MEMERWQMSRVGIFNFWYYDEEEFELEDGRLILRGANGSGKSVTMQSFLPLVLDGDKRSHRLDPFGSRDRRIEYYLLGDGDSDKTDVTGYLWMEFSHPGKGLHKTIGIGLRARRGAAQVQFWGFLLEDGRRIGRDFWLYDRNQWLEMGVRVPLGRKELEEKIGAGGQTVHDASAYRDMVNKQLFGFADADAFQDLLQLMIQLRSPKLSKDFKPSAIYEILHRALPPLQEDELSPLSEVLEDMDQIADRLDEVRLHRKEMAKLQDMYDRYNKQELYAKSVQLLERKAEHDDFARRTAEAEQALQGAERDREAAQAEAERLEGRLQETAAELDVLEKHEAIGKQRELEAATMALGESEKHLSLTRERIGKQRLQADRLARDIGDTEHKYEQLEAEVRDQLDELEAMAQDAEFAEHPVYHRRWGGEVPGEDDWREPWRRDLRQHRERLEQALRKAQQEREAAGLVRELETELGEARRERDGAERERGAEERRLETSKEALREAAVQWRQGLAELPLADEELRSVLAAVSSFSVEQRAYEPIRSPAAEAFAAYRERLMSERVNVARRHDELVAERARLEAEKTSWEHNREPEPARSESKGRARRDRPQQSGAPLYEVCDFQGHIDESTQAQVEEALERAGLLDAWIAPDGRLGGLALTDEQEEAWLVPEPHDIGYTLADILKPSPSAESGLSAAVIDAALRTFLWDEGGDMTSYRAVGGVVSARGEYRLGPLVGKSASKARAEFIGKETRKRTRLLEISRLKQAMEALDEQIAALRVEQERLQEREAAARAELAAFPSGLELQRGLQSLLEAVFRLEAAMRQEQRALDRFKEKSAEWRELQRQLVELTAGWSRLKREQDLQAALTVCRDYESALGELHSVWRQIREAAAALDRYRGEIDSVTVALDDDEALADELEERRRTLRAQVETLRKLMDELGLSDVARQIEALKAERQQLFGVRRSNMQTLDEAKQRTATFGERFRNYREQLAALLGRLEASAAAWRGELGRGLVAEWRDAASAEADLKLSHTLGKEIKACYDSLFASGNPETAKARLLEQYNAVRLVLNDYVLESVVEEATGRILIQSMRDRQRPQPPLVLLEELQRTEEEQSLLLSEKDRELYEEIILRSVGKAIRQRIHRAEQWVKQMNRLMEERNTSSGLRLKLKWEPKSTASDKELDTSILIDLLKRDSHRLREEEIDAMIGHFRSQIARAKEKAQEEQESLRKHLYELLDYRNWFEFELQYRKGEQIGYRPLTDSKFNVFSGGEKAMAMYIPLFAATWSRYSDARPDAPRIISLDEAFAGVDEENMRDMFQLLTDMGFDFMMTSQVLWGCYDTVPKLAIYEIYRPKDVDFVTLFHYRWNGRVREYVQDEGGDAS